MKRLFLRSLLALQVHRLTRFLYRSKVVVLAYHGFTDQRTHPGIENSQGKHLHVDTFRAQLAYLAKHYNVVPLQQIVDHYAGRAPLPPRALAITIDDGYESNYALAFPALAEHHLPATIFLTTDFVDQKELQWTDRIEYSLSATSAPRLDVAVGDRRLSYDLSSRALKLACDRDLRTRLKMIPQESRSAIVDSIETRLEKRLRIGEDIAPIYRPLAWPQVREMLASGLISVGSHTVSHLIITRCAPDRAREELVTSKRRIEQQTTTPCRLFCYPNGQVGCFDDSTKAMLGDAGYWCGITTVFGMNNGSSDVFELKRLYTDKPDMSRFVLTVSGVIGLLDGAKRMLTATGSGR